MNDYDEQNDDGVDDSPADPVEQTPDSEQAAEAIDAGDAPEETSNDEESDLVVGRRNTELPLEMPKPSRS